MRGWRATWRWALLLGSDHDPVRKSAVKKE